MLITDYNKKENNKRWCVYKITCMCNGKIYVGSTKNLYTKLISYAFGFRHKLNKKVNRAMLDDCAIYGVESFVYEVIEDTKHDIDYRLDRETYWIKKLMSTDETIGYNFTFDDSNGRHFTKQYKDSLSRAGKRRHKNDPELAQRLASMLKGRVFREESRQKLAEKKHKYNIVQLDKSMTIIKVWHCVKDIVESEIQARWQNIYSNCNGHKPGKHRGFYWRYLEREETNPENYIRIQYD